MLFAEGSRRGGRASAAGPAGLPGAAQGHGSWACSARTSGGGQPAMGDGGACCSQHREEHSRESSRGARGPRGRRPTAVGARPGSVGSGLRRKMAEHPEHVGDHGGARPKHDRKRKNERKKVNSDGLIPRRTLRCIEQ